MSVGHALLGILARGPAHGYDLKREHDERFPGAKPLAYGQVYATLARLERDGDAEIAETAQGGGPERTVYSLTPEGRRTLSDWLEQVEPAGPADRPGPHHRPSGCRPPLARDRRSAHRAQGKGTHMTEVILSARAVEKSFGRTPALRGVSLELVRGEVLAVTGPSGSGKSTLLHCLSGILRPDAGEVLYEGQRLDELAEAPRTRLRRREFGIVLQFGQLVPELTVVQNVALPLLLEGQDRYAARTAARAWLDRLDVGELATALPGELSGGEVQRAALARALVTGPQVVFADEPTGALDTVGGEALLAVLLSTARERGVSVVLVTHDNRVAARADREVVLVDGSFTADSAARVRL